jgi:hypothetical protein
MFYICYWLSKYITNTLEKNYSKIIELHSLVVGIDHNQRKHSGKHEYKRL